MHVGQVFCQASRGLVERGAVPAGVDPFKPGRVTRRRVAETVRYECTVNIDEGMRHGAADRPTGGAPSVEAMQAAFASPEAQAVTADVANFLDLSRFQMPRVTEQEVPLAVEATA